MVLMAAVFFPPAWLMGVVGASLAMGSAFGLVSGRLGSCKLRKLLGNGLTGWRLSPVPSSSGCVIHEL